MPDHQPHQPGEPLDPPYRTLVPPAPVPPAPVPPAPVSAEPVPTEPVPTEPVPPPPPPYTTKVPALAPDPDPHAAIPALQAALTDAIGSRYEILEAIAIGGMATIIQIRHRIHRGLYVAKVLHPHLAQRPQIVSAFHREMTLITQLASHPNIVPVTDAFFTGTLNCIIMPFVEGEDLDHILRLAGKFTREQALMFLAQLASFLMYAETLGIAHCDLSPGNIRLDHFGNYRVLDFGLARATRNSASETELPSAGTPAYNSPEQILGPGRAAPPDRRSDLYALGVIFAELLAGSPLFHAPTLPELAEKHLQGLFTLPPDIESDTPIAALIRSLVAVDPAQRMDNAFLLSGAIAAMGFEVPSSERSLLTTLTRPPVIRRQRLQPIPNA